MLHGVSKLNFHFYHLPYPSLLASLSGANIAYIHSLTKITIIDNELTDLQLDAWMKQCRATGPLT